MDDEADLVWEGFLQPFFRETGYSKRDILSFNYHTCMVVTRNGGIYQMVDGEVKWLKGPPVHVDDRI